MSQERMPIAVKNSPRSHHAFITYVLHLVTCLTGNASFPNASPSPPQLKLLADGFAQANADAKGGAQGTVAERNSQRLDLEEQLDHLVDNVRATVKAHATDPAAAIAMILSTGLSVKKQRTAKKAPFAAKHGSVSGVVVVIALAVAKTAMYYWEYSVDQKVWTSVPETMKARTAISGLTPGQTYYFRFHVKTRKGLGDYSDVVKLIAL